MVAIVNSLFKRNKSRAPFSSSLPTVSHRDCTVTNSVAAGTILALSALGSRTRFTRESFQAFSEILHDHQLHRDVWGTNGAADYSFLVADTWNMIGFVYEACGQHKEAMASFSEAFWL
jgi:hypothetical protein